MTAVEPLSAELQRIVAERVAEAVAAERARIVAALSRWLELSAGSWPHDGRIARAEVARWVRWIADCGPAFDREASNEAPVAAVGPRSALSEGYAKSNTGSGQMRALSEPRSIRMPMVVRYDRNPTVDSRDPQAWAKYAADLDTWVQGWWRDDLDAMAPGLAEEARRRRDLVGYQDTDEPTEGDPR